MGDTTIKNLKKGGFILIDDIPCKVVAVNISKSGKHGAAKGRVEGMGLFDGRRRNIIKPADAKVSVPILLKKQGQVLAIVGEKVQLMDMVDYSTFELDMPEEMKGKLESGQEIIYYEIQGVRTLQAPR
ncbi:MAG: translation initiation factor IF-5A [Candidatus Aenigmarchaeota archaeon CG_4_10_14_0_8_um_filter_37_24]|nr:translation initiation factor IF-5A [Candidatus Aenigmarchaeota archaeon]OIN88082.1 MAG: translation initiation factor IF-5A [Candidatus Aenigmarchaeota archaeon CG1_02_38_14]PIV69445.1 MAG: translation initiation factor IF-5A [Candidatus Aenigmarchaeota archaeon CG01_land_8_20_14_3_00_37_9]PIW40985.1 MAG: translation initiation factor IF-5A [Candidatus Aenigmarchaeota archaeon CG15_BIG_FIL_POST_REV_8_21_14_020_37_27]PIX50398.1 MAG: translation initiation factor IF-5A [Candidatus Aenigmarcha